MKRDTKLLLCRAREVLLRTALRQSMIALDDWLRIFADTECTPEHVRDAQDRIMHAGGTLAYIAQVQKANREALAFRPRPKARKRNV